MPDFSLGGFSDFLGVGKSVYTYSPQDVTILLDSHQVSGYVDGAFISVELPQEQQFKIRRAADGVTHRSYHPLTGFFVRLRIVQSSPTNDFLDGMLKSDTVTLNNFFTLSVKDTRGSTSLNAGECFIAKAPDVQFSNGIEEREWLIYCSEISAYTIGGNENDVGIFGVLGQVVNAIKLGRGLFK